MLIGSYISLTKLKVCWTVCFIEEIVRTLRASLVLQRAAETLPEKTTTTDSSSPARLIKNNSI